MLADTDVLTWWGHNAHDAVSDAVVEAVQARVLNGMGLIVLHPGHQAKIFMRLMGTACSLTWRESGERERVWVVSPGHPIVEGLDPCFVIPHTETYGEYFDIPQPDNLITVSWYQGGEAFRSGWCFYRGRDKIFYFATGHETFPIYYQPEVRRIIGNAVRWAAPVRVAGFRGMYRTPKSPVPMESISS